MGRAVVGAAVRRMGRLGAEVAVAADHTPRAAAVVDHMPRVAVVAARRARWFLSARLAGKQVAWLGNARPALAAVDALLEPTADMPRAGDSESPCRRDFTSPPLPWACNR